MTDEDFEWFEYKYPGWYDKYGKWWENYNRLSMPNGHNPIVFEDVDYAVPAPVLDLHGPVPGPRGHGLRPRSTAVVRTYCHEECRWTDVSAFRPTYHGPVHPNMGQLIGHREWETLYHGWNWADVVSDMGYVRDDGKTMTAQPHLQPGRPEEDVDAGPPAPLPPLQSPNVLFNEMTPEGARGVPREATSAAARRRFAPARLSVSRPRAESSAARKEGRRPRPSALLSLTSDKTARDARNGRSATR